jgi:hypothetical protein
VRNLFGGAVDLDLLFQSSRKDARILEGMGRNQAFEEHQLMEVYFHSQEP